MGERERGPCSFLTAFGESAKPTCLAESGNPRSELFVKKTDIIGKFTVPWAYKSASQVRQAHHRITYELTDGFSGQTA